MDKFFIQTDNVIYAKIANFRISPPPRFQMQLVYACMYSYFVYNFCYISCIAI